MKSIKSISFNDNNGDGRDFDCNEVLKELFSLLINLRVVGFFDMVRCISKNYSILICSVFVCL